MLRKLLLAARLALVLWVGALGLVGAAHAQSACTAMWGLTQLVNAPFTNFLAYYNTSSNRWVNTVDVTAVLGTGPTANALAGSTSSSLLYFIDRNNRQLYNYNPNTNAVSASLGVVPAPPAPAFTGNILGATFDLNGRLFMYATEGPPNTGFMTIAQINTATAAIVGTWTQVLTTSGVTPTIASSGDINIGTNGVAYVISNTAPQPTYHVIDLTPGASFGRTNSPALTVTGADNLGVRGVAVNPVNGTVYFGGTQTFPGATGDLYTLNPTTGASTLVQSSTSFVVQDMGNCPFPPATPTISKTFSPTYRATGPGTATAVIRIANSNTAPLFLFSEFKDTLPAGMTVANPTALASTCNSAFGNANTVVGSTSVTFAIGGRIPAGGCSITFNVTAPLSTVAYINTIPAGGLVTSAGSNTFAATASFVVNATADFQVTKLQRTQTSGAFTASPLTVPGGSTIQYTIQVFASTFAAGGSATFTDTIPSFITPVLSVQSSLLGGIGSCAVTTSTVANSTQIRGTLTSVASGGGCVITVTARVSATLAVSTTGVNSVTVVARPGQRETITTNNTGSVTTTVGPSTTLTVAKTNGVGSLVAGQTVAYTVTIANLGPAAAPGTTFTDPAVSGLSCTTVSCSVTAGASCPPVLTVGALQSTGLQITPTFAALSTATFVVTCGVSATGF